MLILNAWTGHCGMDVKCYFNYYVVYTILIDKGHIKIGILNHLG